MIISKLRSSPGLKLADCNKQATNPQLPPSLGEEEWFYRLRLRVTEPTLGRGAWDRHSPRDGAYHLQGPHQSRCGTPSTPGYRRSRRPSTRRRGRRHHLAPARRRRRTGGGRRRAQREAAEQRLGHRPGQEREEVAREDGGAEGRLQEPREEGARGGEEEDERGEGGEELEVVGSSHGRRHRRRLGLGALREFRVAPRWSSSRDGVLSSR